MDHVMPSPRIEYTHGPGRFDRLNRALDAVTRRFGKKAVTRGMVHAERAAPSRRIK